MGYWIGPSGDDQTSYTHVSEDILFLTLPDYSDVAQEFFSWHAGQSSSHLHSGYPEHGVGRPSFAIERVGLDAGGVIGLVPVKAEHQSSDGRFRMPRWRRSAANRTMMACRTFRIPGRTSQGPPYYPKGPRVTPCGIG